MESNVNKFLSTYRRVFVLSIIMLGLTFVLPVNIVLSQEQSLWTKEEVDEARKGIDYSGEPEPKPESPPEQPQGEPENQQKNESEFWRSVKNFFNSPGGKIIVFTLVIALLVFTILKFINTRRVRRDQKIALLDPSTLSDIEENVPESDIEKFLRLAVEAGNYKLAVRLMYLRLLQQLHEAGKIVWKKEKTNRDYVRELRKHGHSGIFGELTLAFEIVWYGDTDVSREKYDILAKAFSSFNINLNGSK
ncbi:MAG: hypothetical protein RL220_343 [Bacteroidota bacterium]